MSLPLANAIDRRGGPADWWISGGRWYPAAALGEPDRLVSYGVMRLVRLTVEPLRICLTFDVGESDARSIDEALRFLADLAPPPNHFELRYLKTAWACERFSSLDGLAGRVRHLLQTRDIELPPLVSIRPRARARFGDLDPVLSQALEAWHLDRDARNWQHLEAGRRALFIHADGEDLLFDYVGPDSECAWIQGDDWRSQAVGTSFNAVFDDEHYNARTSESVWRALESCEPIVEDIVAFLDLGDHDVWLPYERALLPSPTGLTVITKVNSDRPLPLLDQI